jgi:uncharacterized protein (TIRG00374 family)
VSSERRPRHPAARAFNLIALLVGIVAFAFVVRELGWSGIEQAVVGTGTWFIAIAAIDVVGSIVGDAAAVYGFLRPHTDVAFRHVVVAQLSGMAINRLTPGNTLGEPVKVTMLVRSGVPTDVAVSTIMIFNLTTMYVGIAAIVIGVPLTALLLDLPPDVARAVWIALAVLVVFALAVMVLVKRGALGSIVRVLSRLHVISAPRAARWQSAVQQIDARVGDLGNLRRPGVLRGVAGVLASRAFNWLGTIVVLYAADIPMTAPLVIASLSVGILVTWISNVIPLGLGLADGTNYVLYGILGASSVAGLLFTLINRLRTIFLALIGLTVMTIANILRRRAG